LKHLYEGEHKEVIMKKKLLFIITCLLLLSKQIIYAFDTNNTLTIEKKCEQLKDILTFDVSKAEDSSVKVTLKPAWLFILKQQNEFSRINNFLKKDVGEFIDENNQEVVIKCKEVINQLDFAKTRVLSEKPDQQKKTSKDKKLFPTFFNLENKINTFYEQNKSFLENKKLKITNKRNLLKAMRMFKAIQHIVTTSDDIVPKMSTHNFHVDKAE